MKKKKRRKSKRNAKNFIYFFTRAYKVSRERNWYDNYQGWLVKDGLGFLDSLHWIQNLEIMPNKNRWNWTHKVKKKFKKLIALRFMLRRRYIDYKARDFKRLRFFIKKKKNKLAFIFFFFEGCISTITIRFHFFWNIVRACYWIPQGALALNNVRIFRNKVRVRLNDIISILGPISVFANRLVRLNGIKYFHQGFYLSFNYHINLYIIYSGIVLRLPFTTTEMKYITIKKRKNWIHLETFLFFTNSFY